MHKQKAIIFILVAFLSFAGLLFSSTGHATSVQKIENFSLFEDGSFPKGWRSRGGNAADVYQVKSDHEAYLQANAENSAVAIAKKFTYELSQYPYLKWQWRVVRLPQGGDERFKETGDSAAAIYVIFEGFIRPDIIKYVWSASLPMKTMTQSPYNSKTKIVVLENQYSPLDQWIEEKVDVYADYKKLFEKKPEQVQAIGLMSDSDNTKSLAIAHYKCIAVCTNK
jgi:hypothetical protein